MLLPVLCIFLLSEFMHVFTLRTFIRYTNLNVEHFPIEEAYAALVLHDFLSLHLLCSSYDYHLRIK